MKSKITGGATEFLFSAKVLGQYDVDYYRCTDTGFIQTDDPFWLAEAYSDAISSLDVGLVTRNVHLSREVALLIDKCLPTSSRFLDFGGGYGLFVRLMRDAGFNFYWQDKYCENLFAVDFDMRHASGPFDVVTAFEVFEHLSNPIPQIEDILSFADTLIFSTELVPRTPLRSADDWSYLVPETGQHIALWTVKVLSEIANKTNTFFYTNKTNLHMLSCHEVQPPPFSKFCRQSVYKVLSRIAFSLARGSLRQTRTSLTQSDFLSARMCTVSLPKEDRRTAGPASTNS